MPDLAFVLVEKPVYPDAAALMESVNALGFAATLSTENDMLSLELEDGGLFIIMLVAAPHPDAPHMGTGPTSISPDEAAGAPAHFILTSMGFEGSELARDTRMAALTSAVIDNVPAVGAMLGHGAVFHKAALFADLAKVGVEDGALPPELAVDITAVRESHERMSFLTHGLARYGREEFYVTCPIKGKGALDFVFGLVRWMMTDREKELPTGETLGRSEDEKVTIQRVPNPTGAGAPVIRLDLVS
jgi:hypothetical protein